jgi:NADPH-dependent ferric siderophore reductase
MAVDETEVEAAPGGDDTGAVIQVPSYDDQMTEPTYDLLRVRVLDTCHTPQGDLARVAARQRDMDSPETLTWWAPVEDLATRPG